MWRCTGAKTLGTFSTKAPNTLGRTLARNKSGTEEPGVPGPHQCPDHPCAEFKTPRSLTGQPTPVRRLPPARPRAAAAEGSGRRAKASKLMPPLIRLRPADLLTGRGRTPGPSRRASFVTANRATQRQRRDRGVRRHRHRRRARTQAFGPRGQLCPGPGPPGLRTVELHDRQREEVTQENLPRPKDSERRPPTNLQSRTCASGAG